MVYISCTTTRKRLSLFYFTYKSLKRQKYDKYKIVLNISSEGYLYDEGISSIPDWLKKEDIIIKWVPNTGPYRKLLPLINEIDEMDIVITVDDDILYHENWIKDLINASELHKNKIIASRGRIIKKTFYGNYKNYRQWNVVKREMDGLDIIPIGCGGILYRKRFLDLNFTNDKKFLEISSTSDDLWFKYAALLKKTSTYVNPAFDEKNITLDHKYGLFYLTNVFFKKNNNMIKKAFSLAIDLLLGHLGINTGNNDKNWDEIGKYLKRKYNFRIKDVI